MGISQKVRWLDSANSLAKAVGHGAIQRDAQINSGLVYTCRRACCTVWGSGQVARKGHNSKLDVECCASKQLVCILILILLLIFPPSFISQVMVDVWGGLCPARLNPLKSELNNYCFERLIHSATLLFWLLWRRWGLLVRVKETEVQNSDSPILCNWKGLGLDYIRLSCLTWDYVRLLLPTETSSLGPSRTSSALSTQPRQWWRTF